MARKRITVRLDGSLAERLQSKCGETGNDASHITRKALEDFLAVGKDDQKQSVTSALVLPPEIVPHTREFMGFSGNLRREIRCQFIRLLAASYVASRHFPKSEGIKKLYANLLEVSTLIDLEQTVRQMPNVPSFRQFDDYTWSEDA
jgi:hypothetical protein